MPGVARVVISSALADDARANAPMAARTVISFFISDFPCVTPRVHSLMVDAQGSQVVLVDTHIS
jgi:hypothetical protein